MPLATEEKPSSAPTLQVSSRFQTAKTTLLVDKFMTHFIKGGGIAVIAAVCGIFLFITAQIIPLFKGAEVKPTHSYELLKGKYEILGADEWGELPFVVDGQGILSFYSLKSKEPVKIINPAEELEKKISSFHYSEKSQKIVYGTEDGLVFLVEIHYEPQYLPEGRIIDVVVTIGDPLPLSESPSPIIDIALGESDSDKMIVGIQKDSERLKINAISLSQETSLFGSGEVVVDQRYELTDEIRGTPSKVLVNSQADGIVVSTDEGAVHFFYEDRGKLALRQKFSPFEDSQDESLASVNFLFGDVSLVVSNAEGQNRIYSLFVPEGEKHRYFGLTKTFKPLSQGAAFYNASLRNKAFLIGSENTASLRYATTEAIRWEEQLPFQISQAAIGRKYDRLFFLDTESNLHVYELKDPHPEAGIKAFFSKIWYEGYTNPGYEWQSTGGTDDFEPKLSLIPLIIGTLKGTFYAMLFAFPIGIIAAVYTSQFAHKKFKLFIKPTMEIMASLPSVVLGFLAALWLAPIMEDKIPSFLLIVIFIPLFSFTFGAFWTSLSIEYRKYIKPGYEWIVMLPVLLGACYAGWVLGPIVEQAFFVVTDSSTGIQYADFRLWWPETFGIPFEQRNSLVVGFMMGFAVIPIIFTISEDSLSNVPKVLVSGSLALGASRWQTALNVVLPTAFPGIFSAMMIGLGRAVGETMIVVMATGNTPIMDFNIFSGMRTLSANIAVELPEAPYLGTLYRTLFLGAVVLFVMTFVVNTFAEIIRQHFREKYKTV